MSPSHMRDVSARPPRSWTGAFSFGTRPVPWNFGAGVSTYPQDIYVAGSGGYVGPIPAPLPPPPPGPPPGSWGPMPPLILQPDPLGWVTMPPDATNQGVSGPLIRLNSASIVPGGTPPGPLAIVKTRFLAAGPVCRRRRAVSRNAVLYRGTEASNPFP